MYPALINVKKDQRLVPCVMLVDSLLPSQAKQYIRENRPTLDFELIDFLHPEKFDQEDVKTVLFDFGIIAKQIKNPNDVLTIERMLTLMYQRGLNDGGDAMLRMSAQTGL